ncbi:MAG: PEGA domain-containing protein [Deltaproteobacteria bacterium]|nr:PEGA domain-containing protein [Deltaproteobacteria bacterium]
MRLLLGILLAAAGPEALAPAPPPPLPDPSVLVVVLPGAPDLSGRAAALGPAVTQRVVHLRPGVPVALADVLRPNRAEDQGRAIVEARAQVLEGIAAFENLELDLARETLEEAVEGLVAHLPELDPAGRLALAQGLFAYASSVLFEGQTVAADQLFSALATVEPGFQPEPGRYPSNVVERFEELQGRTAGRATGGLDVYTDPPGAEVYVDGGLRGYAPLTVPDLSEGAHAVTVRHPAFEPAGRLAVVEADENMLVDLALKAVDASALWRALTPQLLGDLAALNQALKPLRVDRVALLVLEEGASDPVARGVWWHRGKAEQIAPTPLPEADESAANVLAQAIVATEAPPLVVAPSPVPDEVADDVPLTARWWFWAALGTVVVAAGVSTAVVATRGGEDGPPRNTAIFGF